MSEHDDNRTDEAIADYLLGEGDPSVRAEFERRMAADPGLRREVEQLSSLMTDLERMPDDAWQGLETDAIEPPPLRLSESIAAEQPAGSSVATEPVASKEPRDGFLARIFGGSFALNPAVGFAAVALVFAGGLGIGLLAGGGDDSPTEPTIAATQQAQLAPIGDLDPQARGVADFDGQGERIRLRLNGLKPSSDRDFYEAWMLDPEKGLISIGSFRVGEDGTGEFDLPAPVAGEEFPVIDISIEPVDGKPAHSQVSVLRGTLN